MMPHRIRFLCILIIIQFAGIHVSGQTKDPAAGELLDSFAELVTPQKLYDYVEILSSDEFEGRLTGHRGYDRSAGWVIAQLSSWGVLPMGEEEYLQYFPHPYTEVLPVCELIMQPGKNGKDPVNYAYIEEFIPGSTSGSGEVTAGVIYAGYGISAPELGYDDYENLDVTGKIVVLEREVPVNTSHEDFLKWRPYSFHQYKLMNAVAHGAAGMLYNYPIANPNNAYSEGFIYSSVGDRVMEDLFHRTGRKPEKTIRKINNKLQPRSFDTGKTVTIRNHTLHYPEGIGSSVIGYLEGSDPDLKDEYILVGGHLDHLGTCYTVMPGAHDNASAVSVTLGLAEALTKLPVELKRSVVFVFFGAEEAALKGVQYFLKHPTMPSLAHIKGYINMDGVGIGDGIHAAYAENYPAFYSYLDAANQHGPGHRLSGSYTSNTGRPRLDAAYFDWYGIPVLSIYTQGGPEAFEGYRYHTPYDDIGNIDSGIMYDLAELLLLSIVNLANADALEFNRGNANPEFIE